MSGWGTPDVGMAFRDLITSIAEGVVNRLRPKVRYGKVISSNPGRNTAEVLLVGETDTISVKYGAVGPSIQRGASNDIVRVEGEPGNYWIGPAIDNRPVIRDPQMIYPQIWGGAWLNMKEASYYSNEQQLPPVGQVVDVVQMDNGSGFYFNASAEIEFHVSKWLSGFGERTVYKFNVHNLTDNDWRVLIPTSQTNANDSLDYTFEARTTSRVLTIRMRRTHSRDVYNDKFYWHIWARGAYYDQVYGLDHTPYTDTEPTLAYGASAQAETDDKSGINQPKGPFFDSPRYTFQDRLQQNLMGGGVVKWDGVNLAWNSPFKAIIGVNEYTSTGRIEMSQPAAGTYMSTHGFGPTLAFQLITANGVDMTFANVTRSTLYYDPPVRGAGATSDARWHLVGNNNLFHVPSHWIMVATMDLTNAGNTLKLGTGREMDYWRFPTLLNGWTNYGTPFDPIGYKREGMKTYLQGLGVGTTPSSTIFSLPAGFRPGASKILVGVSNVQNTGAASAGTAHTHQVNPIGSRIDVTASGSVVHNGGGLGYQSFEGMFFEALN